MKKRSAMLVAAGLVAALLAGGTALSFSLAGETASAQSSRVRPVVKTERRTVTVHKKAKSGPARVVTITTSGSASTGVTDPSTATYEDSSETETESETEDSTETESETDSDFSSSSADSSSEDGSGGDD
jgi:hypothetical protein